MDDWKRHSKVAVGGWRCPCCGPKRRDRPEARRAIRRRLMQALKDHLDTLDMTTGLPKEGTQ